MKSAMREEILRERIAPRLSERNQHADQLVEFWAKKEGVGKGLKDLYSKDMQKARGLAIVLENEDAHLHGLSETTISTSFQTTPQNVLRIVRLGYPNSIRGDLFMEWPMETARDAIYYLTPVKDQVLRDNSVANGSVYDDFDWQYPSEINEINTSANGDGTTLTFTVANGNLKLPLRPFSVKVFMNAAPATNAKAFIQVAQDDGNGNLVGPDIDTGSVIDYTSTGGMTIVFKAGTAPALNAQIKLQYFMNSENSGRYADIGSVSLQLRSYQFNVKPWPLYVSWSKMTELLLGTTLNIDAEEALVRGAGDELKKALDFFALTLGYRTAMSNVTGANPLIQFDTAGAVGEAEILRAQAITRQINKMGNQILNTINRGGITHIFGGPGAIEYLKMHEKFDDAGSQPEVGAHRVGSLGKIDMYKAPSAIVPDDFLVGVYRNPQVPEDVSLAFGTLIPLYKSMTLEYKQMYSELGLAMFGDAVVLNSQYLVPMQIKNL